MSSEGEKFDFNSSPSTCQSRRRKHKTLSDVIDKLDVLCTHGIFLFSITSRCYWLFYCCFPFTQEGGRLLFQYDILVDTTSYVDFLFKILKLYLGKLKISESEKETNYTFRSKGVVS